MNYPPLDKWNYVNLLLCQAFLGAITANVRAISLGFEANEWKIQLILEHEDEEDREWLSEALSDFEAMDPTAAGSYRWEFVVTRERIVPPPPPARLIYLRRELSGDADADASL